MQLQFRYNVITLQLYYSYIWKFYIQKSYDNFLDTPLN